MRILFISSQLSENEGWGTFSLELINRAVKNFEVSLITSANDTSTINSAVNILPFKAESSTDKSKTSLLIKDFFRLRSVVGNYDIIHCLTENFIPLAVALKSHTKKLIVTIHGTFAISYFLKKRKLNNLLYKFSYKKVDLIMSVSEFTKKKFLQHAPQFANKTKVIPPGTNLVINDDEFNLLNKQNIIVSLGTLKPRKGIIESLLAFKKFADDFETDFKYYIIGDTSKDAKYNKKVKDLIDELNLNNRVFITGKLPKAEVAKLLSQSKLLLMPSISVNNKFEGFGLVHLEAYGYGTPSIGSNNCGHEQVIQNGKTGFLTTQSDINDLYERMKTILLDENNWKQFSNNAYNYAKANTWDVTYELYKTEYVNLLS